MVELTLPSTDYKESYIEGINEFQEEGLLLQLDTKKMEAHFDQYMKDVHAQTEGIGLPSGYSPQTEYWLVDDGEYIGTTKIRHILNKKLAQTEGHIGYHIRPSKRRQGYGTKILALALPKAKELGINPVMVACDEGNVGSQKIIESNGGVLENIVSNGDGPRRLRYWITVA